MRVILNRTNPNSGLLFLILVILVGTFLRFYALGVESIWYDEASAINLSIQNIATVLRDCAVTQNHPPLYFVLLHYWIELFGTSEVATRSLSVIFGIVSMLVIYKIGLSLYNRTLGLLACLLSATSFFHIAYSQEVRSYSLLLLLSLLSYYSFIKILQVNNKRWYFTYFISNILLSYTHAYGILITASQAIIMIFVWSRHREVVFKFLGTLGAIILVSIPLLLLMSGRITQFVTDGFWVPEPVLADIGKTLVAFSAYWGRDIAKLIVIIFAPLIIVSFFSINEISGEWNWRSPVASLEKLKWRISLDQFEVSLILTVWLLAPIVLAFIQSKLITPTYQIRYLIGASPALYLLIAKGLTSISKKKLFYPILVLIIAMSSIGLYNYYIDEFKDPWRDVGGFVEANSYRDDCIIADLAYNGEPFLHYYHGSAVVYIIPWELQEPIDKCQYIQEISHGKKGVWVITNSTDINLFIGCLEGLDGNNKLQVNRVQFGTLSALSVKLSK
ncbi:glycosyltransferase family 39 protein [Chloroflexota bacterium]